MRLFGEFARGGPLTHGRDDPASWIARRLAIMWLRRYEFRFGINIPFDTRIGPGLYIGHHGAITVHDRATIGKNCNLSQEVTIGEVQTGPNLGVPTIGDNVYIGPGAKVIGNINVGDDVVIGANCVVARDVPDDAVIAGVPGRVLHYTGSDEFVRYRVP
jgi:serine O-acetyltransferase